MSYESAKPWSGCPANHRFQNTNPRGIDPIYFCELTAGHEGDHRALIARPRGNEVQWPSETTGGQVESEGSGVSVKITGQTMNDAAAIGAGVAWTLPSTFKRRWIDRLLRRNGRPG